jgi:hypothetical protein
MRLFFYFASRLVQWILSTKLFVLLWNLLYARGWNSILFAKDSGTSIQGGGGMTWLLNRFVIA